MQYNIEKLRHRVLNVEGAREGGQEEGRGEGGKKGRRGRKGCRQLNGHVWKGNRAKGREEDMGNGDSGEGTT